MLTVLMVTACTLIVCGLLATVLCLGHTLADNVGSDS